MCGSEPFPGKSVERGELGVKGRYYGASSIGYQGEVDSSRISISSKSKSN